MNKDPYIGNRLGLFIRISGLGGVKGVKSCVWGIGEVRRQGKDRVARKTQPAAYLGERS